jgi:hypothetical protein
MGEFRLLHLPLNFRRKSLSTVQAVKEVKKVNHVTLNDLMSLEDKSNFEYVSVPAKDDRGFEHPDICLNAYRFEAGKKHFVHPTVAAAIKNRLDTFRQTVLRSLLSNRDPKAMQKFPETN